MTIGFDLGHDLDLNFEGQILKISYISAKSGPIATKRKANISIELQASNVTMVWIYQIVTGVTLVGGVPSTHLVNYVDGLQCIKPAVMIEEIMG